MDQFRYCAVCGWEGKNRLDCPECGADTRDGGLLI